MSKFKRTCKKHRPCALVEMLSESAEETKGPVIICSKLQVLSENVKCQKALFTFFLTSRLALALSK